MSDPFAPPPLSHEPWWWTAWQEVVQRSADPGRRRRARRLLAAGDLIDLRMDAAAGGAGRITGVVPRGLGGMYTFSLQWPQLSAEQWTAVIDQLSKRAVFIAQLLAGEIPAEIEEAFSAAEARFLPAALIDLQPRCTCQDWAPLCKHTLALFYAVGDRLRNEPLQLFELHGRAPEAVLAAVRARRGTAVATPAAPAPSQTPPLETQIPDFWRSKTDPRRISFAIKPPQTPQPALHRLGQPPFLDDDLQKELAPLYELVTREAVTIAFNYFAQADEQF